MEANTWNAAAFTSPEMHALAGIDWDFPNRAGPTLIESIHPYPARFVAELPRTLLSRLPIPSGSAVLDPFCGSGTTLVEAQRLGLSSVGIDVNPIACLMTRVKTAAQPADLKTVVNATVALARAERNPDIPDIPRLKHWFDEEARTSLAAISHAIGGAPALHRDALSLALSAVVGRVSRRGGIARRAAARGCIAARRVFQEFVRASRRMQAALAGRNYPLPARAIVETDLLALDPARIGRRIGIVVTSPPYPNVYDYWRCNEYPMHWLGFSPKDVSSREIGARAHFPTHACRPRRRFREQMEQTFRWVREVLVEDGHVCMVIGRSRIHRRDVDNAELLETAARSAGFELAFAARRRLPARRGPFGTAPADRRTESVLVWKRRAAISRPTMHAAVSRANGGTRISA